MSDPRLLVISTSLRRGSHSRRLARYAFEVLDAAGANVEWLDLRDLDLPVCDGDACYAHPNTLQLSEIVSGADGILFGLPVYNYSVSAAAKNVIELAGSAFNEKVVAFACAAGGRNGYMSVMHLANALMLDFRCMVIPRFAFAPGDAFDDNGKIDSAIRDRVRTCATELAGVTTALRGTHSGIATAC